MDHHLLDCEAGPKPDTSRVLRKSLLVIAVALLAVILLSSAVMIGASPRLSLFRRHDSDIDNVKGFKILPILLRNLVEEGLIKNGHRGFVSGAGTGDLGADLGFLRDSGIELLSGADLKPGHAEVFDFVFATDFLRAQALDTAVKENGLLIAPLSRNPSNGLRLSSGYTIVYMRRFKSTVVAMRKNGPESSKEAQKALLWSKVTPEEKKAALEGLEDVDLEPPRSSKPSFISRKIKFLPELLSDALDEYPRRVFISDDSSAVDWFYGNYPTNDQEFEVYNVGVGSNGGASKWLAEKVRREDYVVMKAEAQVVEEMLRDKTVSLVDELFLECKNQWVDGEEVEKGSKRAYWQCLDLYGKVRDEGIAVHQWWD